jgi:hypothetical protein
MELSRLIGSARKMGVAAALVVAIGGGASLVAPQSSSLYLVPEAQACTVEYVYDTYRECNWVGDLSTLTMQLKCYTVSVFLGVRCVEPSGPSLTPVSA